MIFNATTPAKNAGGGYKEVELYISPGANDIQAWYLDENGEYQHYMTDGSQVGEYHYLKVASPSVFSIRIQNAEFQNDPAYYVKRGELCTSLRSVSGKTTTILATYHI
jgi:hypothetical protein